MAAASRKGVVRVVRVLPIAGLVAFGAAPIAFVASRGVLSHPEVDPGALADSLTFALAGALLASALGAAAAWITGTLEFPGRRLSMLLLALPLAAPPAYWWLGIARAPGVQGHAFHGLAAGTLVAALALAPVPYLLTLSAAREISPSTYDAARLALPPVRRLVFVLLPLCRGALAAGFLLAVVLLLGESEVPFLFGFRTLTTEVVTSFSRTFDASRVAPIAVPLLASALAAGIAARRPLLGNLLARRAGDGIRRRRTPAASAAALLLAAPAMWALTGYALSAAPALASRRPSPYSGAAVGASIAEPVLCALFALVVGVAAASLARRSRTLPTFLGLGLLVFCVPASVLAIGWIGLGASSGTEVPPAVVHLSRLWPLGALAFMAALARLPRSLEDAAALVPMSRLGRTFRLVLPVLAP